MKNKEEYIICAANHFLDDNEYAHQPKNIKKGIVICGRRHHNIFATLKGLGVDRLKYTKCKQGFLTSKDIWVDRTDAAKIAFEAGQTEKNVKTLFSEDLY